MINGLYLFSHFRSYGFGLVVNIFCHLVFIYLVIWFLTLSLQKPNNKKFGFCINSDFGFPLWFYQKVKLLCTCVEHGVKISIGWKLGAQQTEDVILEWNKSGLRPEGSNSLMLNAKHHRFNFQFHEILLVFKTHRSGVYITIIGV